MQRVRTKVVGFPSPDTAEVLPSLPGYDDGDTLTIYSALIPPERRFPSAEFILLIEGIRFCGGEPIALMKEETRELIFMFRNLGKWWDRYPGQSGAFIKGSQGRKDIAWQLRYYKHERGRVGVRSVLLAVHNGWPA